MKIKTILIIAFLLTSCTWRPVGYDFPPKHVETRYYDEQGEYTGKSYQQRDTIRYYDKNGIYTGTGKVK